MCLAVPMKVLHVEEMTADVDIGGIKKRVRLDIIEPKPVTGDYVIVHAGFAIHIIDEKEAKITLGYLKEVLACGTETSQ
ncbi:MAG: HypC/HybG/HupF family hydrogenase formation chaperone [Thermodesulfobacteriota bacterium]|nr:HypC/HybG/HupF family hydrogenase formation chaperone [Thermodesulfobacteriota bacterium]